VDPSTGNPKPTAPTVVTDVPARIQQRTTTRVGLQIEMTAEQDTVISVWSIYVGHNTVLTAKSTVTDAAGRVFVMEGPVADRPEHRPQHRVGTARLISDMQT
jgi:hypothetical protein